MEAKNNDLMAPTMEYGIMDRMAAECMNASSDPDSPLVHRFTSGMYIREIYMDKETIHVTKIHQTCHPFVISKGKVSVSLDGENWVHLQAPHTGITTPGTQRVIVVHEDTVWTTFHPNPDNFRDLVQLEDVIIKKHEVPKELLSKIPEIPIES